MKLDKNSIFVIITVMLLIVTSCAQTSYDSTEELFEPSSILHPSPILNYEAVEIESYAECRT